MATAVERTKLVMDALLNKNVPNEQLLRVATQFSNYFKNEFNELVADVENPTNEELALFFLKKLTEYGKEIVSSQATSEAISEQRSSIDIAVSTAISDME